jgi:hypothetical protein
MKTIKAERHSNNTHYTIHPWRSRPADSCPTRASSGLPRWFLGGPGAGLAGNSGNQPSLIGPGGGSSGVSGLGTSEHLHDMEGGSNISLMLTTSPIRPR